MPHSLLKIFQSLKPTRIAVVGDVMVDRTRWVRFRDVDGATATPIGSEISTADFPGGAAYVSRLLRAFGCEVTAFGVIGSDTEGTELNNQLNAQGVQSHLLVDAARPTTLKERIVADTALPRLLQRIDRESIAPLSPALVTSLQERLRAEIADCQAAIISDYAKGVCVPAVVSATITEARRCGIPVIVDPAKHANCDLYAGCDVLTPNRSEAEVLAGFPVRSPADAARAGRTICQQSGAMNCIVTIDTEGAMVVGSNGDEQRIPASSQRVIDPTGAGDAFVAALGQAIASGIDVAEGACFANHVAGLQVATFGTAELTRNDVYGSLSPRLRPADSKRVLLAELEGLVQKRRATGEQIVFTNGCFDLLHPGHVGYLEQAAMQGDCLIVAVNADATVTNLKGIGRPVLSADERLRMLAALECVEYVIVFDEPTPHELIRQLRPDVLVKGGDYAIEDVVGRELVDAYGGRVITLGLTPGLSTTQVLRRLSIFQGPQSEAG